MSVKRELRKISTKISRLYQKEINRKDLIDTGALVRSFDTNIKMDKKGNLSVKVKCMYYYQYLNEPFELDYDIFKSKEYSKIQDELVDVMTNYLLVNKDKLFKSTETVEYNFKYFPK